MMDTLKRVVAVTSANEYLEKVGEIIQPRSWSRQQHITDVANALMLTADTVRDVHEWQDHRAYSSHQQRCRATSSVCPLSTVRRRSPRWWREGPPAPSCGHSTGAASWATWT